VQSSQSTTGTNQPGNTVVNNATTTYQYDPLGNSDSTSATGRLVRIKNGSQTLDWDTLYYDAPGNRIFPTRSGRGAGLDRASYYAADRRLKAVDARTLGDLEAVVSVETVAFEQYRYDALGRCVWVRAWRHCQRQDSPGECQLDWVRRTVWNGAQEL
jgi:hypothetical protein